MSTTLPHSLVAKLREPKNRLVRFMAHLDRTDNSDFKAFEQLKYDLHDIDGKSDTDDIYAKASRLLRGLITAALEAGIQIGDSWINIQEKPEMDGYYAVMRKNADLPCFAFYFCEENIWKDDDCKKVIKNITHYRTVSLPEGF